MVVASGTNTYCGQLTVKTSVAAICLMGYSNANEVYEVDGGQGIYEK